MSSIFFNCSNCGVKIEADEDFSGGKVSCPKCKAEIEVPLKGLAKGLEIGGFALIERLGAGGMGEVWLARQLSMERDVALKILSPKLCNNKGFVDRFLNEVKTSAKLIHPNIVTAYGGGFDMGFYYLAVQYVQGIELGVKLRIEKIIPEKEALPIVRGIAEGLNYAWNKYKLLHRDIKPENIFVDKEGNSKLMDMGISKSLMDDVSLTLTGIIVGTPCYMSPEQARGRKDIDCRSDIYSLGATMYHIVTGSLPYDGKTAMEIFSKQLSEPIPPPRNKNPALSGQCSALLEIMMSKNPEGRQHGWDEVIRDIDRVLVGKMPLPRKQGKSMKVKPGINIGNGAQGNTVAHDPSASNRRRMNLIYIAGLTVALIILMFTVAGLLNKVTERNAKSAEVEILENKKNRIEPLKKIEKAVSVQAPVPVPVKTTAPVIVRAPKPELAPEKIKPVPEKPIKETPEKTVIETPDQLREALVRLNPGLTKEKCHIKEENGKWHVNINSPAVTDISPLMGLPIKGLSLFGTNVTDIRPLKGLPITYVNLSGLKISDFSPLKGMPLGSISLVNSQIKDLSVLDNKNMSCLMILNAPVEDVSPLAGMKLTKLWLTNTKVSDLSPLKGIALHELAIEGTKVNNLSPLKGMPLQILSFTPSNFSVKEMTMLHDEMKSLKYIGSSLSEVGQNKQTAEEFWRKYGQNNPR